MKEQQQTLKKLSFSSGNNGNHDYWETTVDDVDYTIIQHKKDTVCQVIAHQKGALRTISFRPYQNGHPWIDISKDAAAEPTNPEYWMVQLKQWLEKGNRAF